MTPEEYVQWIMQCTKMEWWKMIEETLRMYVEDVDRRGEKTFAESYLLLLKLVQDRSTSQ